jgi:hypothetical protein
MLKKIERLHVPLWLVKDMFWMLGYGELSLLFAAPTIIISILLIMVKRGSERYVELMMGFWLTANTFWMAHELFKTNTKGIALVMFMYGIIIFPMYLLKLNDDR